VTEWKRWFSIYFGNRMEVLFAPFSFKKMQEKIQAIRARTA
jgi:hypothetical protein